MPNGFIMIFSEKNIYKIFLIFLFFLLIFVTQYEIKNVDNRQEQKIENLLYLPSGKYLNIVSLGFDQLVADILWLRASTYFGGHLMTDQSYPWLYNMLDTITNLDPKFEYVYHFGGVILALEASQIDNSNAILKKGMENLPEVWEFPFYIGFNYMYFYHDDITAVKYMELVAQYPKVPAYVKTFPATLYKKAGKADKSLLFLQKLYDNSDDPLLRKRIEEKIAGLLEEQKNRQ